MSNTNNNEQSMDNINEENVNDTQMEYGTETIVYASEDATQLWYQRADGSFAAMFFPALDGFLLTFVNNPLVEEFISLSGVSGGHPIDGIEEPSVTKAESAVQVVIEFAAIEVVISTNELEPGQAVFCVVRYMDHDKSGFGVRVGVTVFPTLEEARKSCPTDGGPEPVTGTIVRVVMDDGYYHAECSVVSFDFWPYTKQWLTAYYDQHHDSFWVQNADSFAPVGFPARSELEDFQSGDYCRFSEFAFEQNPNEANDFPGELIGD